MRRLLIQDIDTAVIYLIGINCIIMSRFIGSNILDIGSSKWSQDMSALDADSLGASMGFDQFTLPAVDNVGCYALGYDGSTNEC